MNEMELLKADIVKYGKKIKSANLVSGTWGNISIRHGDKIYITPCGIDYDNLLPEDIVTLNLEGKVIDGTKKPSTELNTHIELYKFREDINSIIHIHSIYATSIAAARKNIPAIVDDMAMIIGGEVPCAKYAFPGSKTIAQNIIEVIENKNAVLLSNHGAICLGRDIEEAFLVCEILEKSAQIYLFSTQIGIPKPLAMEEVEKMRDVYLNIYNSKE
ncbi:aldolase [Fervidicella metallireducens AeB]|uniref:Aldolase n=1 Tax=Fervidicella metallireducens AeB TaxID=1403537 RepID=A0A017RWZ1_9CLOT|nr:class II aldolase/adducin family protein [Fervidicella metallireducens]EYE89202.1 aldolase [Fervidicella metallireducens AeB]